MQQFTSTFNALGSSNQIVIYCQDDKQANGYFELAKEEIFRIEAKYSRYREDSVLSEINRVARSSPVLVDRETEMLITFAVACHQQSGGLFDITSGALRRAWDFKQAIIPSQKVLKETCAAIGWKHVKWAPPYISYRREDTEIDLGGLGKEYAVDQAAQILQAAGVMAGFVNLGGDLRAWGHHPERAHWSFGIADPRKTGEVVCHIDFSDGALASSGDYERYFELDGVRYCHILHPETGMPVMDLQSVSVIAPACMLAGSCATIAMLLGRKRGLKLLRKTGFQFVVIDSLGEMHRSK